MAAVQTASPVASPTLNVVELCAAVGAQLSETDASQGTRFNYQSRLFAAAEVRLRSDGPEVVRAKMQDWWSRNQHLITCNQFGSSVNGSILRLAVEKDAREFINDATRRWHLDLNYVDPEDRGTLLDWLDRELERNESPTRTAVLLRYRALFVQFGAKSARDL